VNEYKGRVLPSIRLSAPEKGMREALRTVDASTWEDLKKKTKNSGEEKKGFLGVWHARAVRAKSWLLKKNFPGEGG